MTSTACRIGEMTPSVELVRALVGLDHDGLDFDTQLDAVAGWERVISWATAHQAEVLVGIDNAAEVAQYGLHAADAARSLADQLGLALGVSGPSAQRRVNTAATLIEKTPAIHSALKVGAITCHHARLAASGATPLDPQVAQAVAAATMTDEHWRTPSQFAEVFHRFVLELDPDGAAERHRRARRGRRVSRRTEPEGMGSLWALLPADDNAAVYDKIDACARSSQATNVPGDDRTLEARRADALVQLVCGQIPNGFSGPAPDHSATGATGASGPTGGANGRPPGDAGDGPAAAAAAVAVEPAAAAASEPTVHGRRPTICVTVSWSSLIGLDDSPAHLTGYGLIDAATARRIAADPTATWHRLLTDPASGRLLDYGRTVYRPPQDVADFVVARDRWCRFPNCDRPARTCDLDHRHDWEDGGTTCAECIDPLCRRHHLLKQQGGWAHFRDPDTGDSIWFDPGGRMHRRPATILPTPAPVEPPRADTAAPGEHPAEPTGRPTGGPTTDVAEPDEDPPF